MKALQTEIKNTIHSHIAVIERVEPYFKSPFHYHPELELVYVKQGNGKRIIGNKLDPFEAEDMVFIGSNLPHVWISDEMYYQELPDLRVRSIVTYFSKEIFSQNFYELRESSKINDLFTRAARGLQIHGNTKKRIAEKLERLKRKKDFERIIGLLEILNVIATSNEVEYITHEGYNSAQLQLKSDRLSEVYKYITENYHNDISLENISRIANLSPTAFCRLFKQRTNRHFVEYLNEVRISNACKFLIETNLNISEIAFQCGYKTLSNFNKIFKKTTGNSPKEYRQKVTL